MDIKNFISDIKQSVKTKKVLMLVLSFLLVSATSVGVSSCGDDTGGTGPSIQQPGDYANDGNYYLSAVDGEYTLSLSDGKVALSLGQTTQFGTYTADENDIQFIFDDKTLATATVVDGNIVLKIGETTYTFLKKTDYTVSYNVDGNVVSSVKVLNGKMVSKPADPVKDGCLFVGWYADAAFTTPFVFDATPVNGDTTIYAYFIEKTVGQSEFAATLIVDGVTLKKQPTVNGALFELPTPEKEGATFAGWWMSDSQDGEKLTCQYTNQVLKENTNLYAVWGSGAPLVSVTSTGVKWNSLGAGVNYTVAIYSGSVEIKTQKTTATEYEFDFASRAAGEFRVEVSANDVKTTAYYTNKALDRVSNFMVSDLSVLVFNPVDNAEKYLITVDCGNDAHMHQEFDNGTSTNFNFANCTMQEGGVTFTVKAIARGYVSSVSETFVYSRDLDDVTGLTFNENDASLIWNPVSKATSYVVEVTSNNKTDKYVVVNNKFSLTNYTGEVAVKVTATSVGYNSSVATATYTLTKMAAPAGVTVANDQIKWSEVTGAEKYNVMIDGVKVGESETTSFALPDNYKAVGLTYTVSVQAVSATATSYYSAPVMVKYGQLEDASYMNGLLTWTPVGGAASYEYTVNGLGRRTFTNGETSAKVTFTKSGDNVILFKVKDVYGNVLGEKEIVVKAYELIIDSRSTLGQADPQYLAVGDTITFPEWSLEGYDFAGWYTVPGGADSNGSEFVGDVYNDTLVYALYAYWMPKEYEVTLMVGEMVFDTVKVKYNQNYTLPTPDMVGGSAFNGWNGSADGTGVQFTNSEGESKGKWTDAEGRTLYATWTEALVATKLQNRDAYSVAMAPGLKELKEVTVPATWTVGEETYPVVEIAGEAFYNCKNLETINIPDTIETIFIGEGGVNAAGSSFFGCDNLKNINVYETEGNHPVYFESEDGVLLRVAQPNVEMENGKELYYFPAGRSGAYEIPEGVQYIPQKTFQNAKITDLVVPSSVSLIGKQAFEKSKLTSVVFTATKAGEMAEDLVLSANAFAYCYSLTSVDFPARLVETDFGGMTIFDNCTVLRDINIVGEDGVYTSVDGMICDATGREIIYCPAGKAGELEIPMVITGIADRAFMGNTKLTKVIIKGNVADIGKEAFMGCRNITTVNFGGTDESSDLTIQEKAFYGCTSLRELVIPANAKKIEAKAFGNTPLNTRVTLNGGANIEYANDVFADDDGVGYVRDIVIGANMGAFEIKGVFNGCSLQGVTVTEGNDNYEADENGVLYSVGKTELLYYPKKLIENYVIPETVTVISAGVFEERLDFATITIGKNVTTIGNNAFKGMTNLQTVVFESGRTAPLTIGDNAFDGCVALTGVELPNTVTSIGAFAFRNCESFETIHLPASLTKLGNDKDMGVFDGCAKLASITVDESNYFESINGIVYAKEEGVSTVMVFVPASYEGAVVIPSTVHTIPANAFLGHQGVTSITWNGDTTTDQLRIGDSAFAGTTALTTVRLPNNLTVIPYALLKDSAVQTVFVPNTVNLIELAAFNNATSLTTLTFESGNEDNTLVFEDGNWTTNGHYTEKILRDVPLTVSGLVLPERVKVIPNYYFQEENANNHNGFENLVIPASIERIGVGAFLGSPKLKTLTFAGDASTRKNVTLGYNAFKNCNQIETLTIPASIKTYDGSDTYNAISVPNKTFVHATFANMKNLTSVTFEDGLVEIGSGMFSGCSKLASVSIPASVKTIGVAAFANTSLASGITIAEGVETIENSAFYATAATSVSIPASVKTIGDYAFNKTASLTALTFAAEGALLNFIGSYAFANSAVASVELPYNSNVPELKLGDYVFQNSAVKTAVIPANVGKLNGAFVGCTSCQVQYSSGAGETDANGFTLADNGKRLLAYNGSATEVVIPDTVEMIGENVFLGNSTITKVTIPSSVKAIEGYAFQNCTALTTVEFAPNSSLVSVGKEAFAATAITAIDLTGVTELGSKAFYNCKSLAQVTLCSDLAVIDASTFENCEALTSITLPERLTTLGSKAFMKSGLTSVTLPELLEHDDVLVGDWFNGCAALAEVTINARNLGVLPSNAFSHCTSLVSLVIPEGVTTISDAFVGATSLKTIEFPTTLTTLHMGVNGFGMTSPFDLTVVETLDFSKTQLSEFTSTKGTSMLHHFYNLSSLKTLLLPATVTSLPSQLIYYCSNLETLSVPGVVALPRFQRCSNLAHVEVSPELVSIADYAFQNCAGLTEFTFPETLETIGQQAFYGTSLSSVEFGTQLETIGQQAFYGTDISSVTIPANLTEIGANAFGGCPNLSAFYVSTSNAKYHAGVYGELYDNSNTLLYFPATSEGGDGRVVLAKDVILGASAFANCKNIREVVLPDMFEIPASLFANSGLSTITIQSSVTSIGASAFNGCTNLETIIIPKSVVSIGNDAFANCTSLKSVIFEEGRDLPLAIGNKVFTNCSSLTSIKFDDNTTIGTTPFGGCASLTEVVLPSAMTNIPTSFFEGCSFKSYTIPANITSIASKAFKGSGLETLTIPKTVTNIAANAFENCLSLTTLVFEGGRTENLTLGNQVFKGCTALTSVTLTDHMTVGTNIFENCTALTSVDFGGFTALGNYMFKATGLVNVTIPKTVTSIGQYAFQSCTSLATLVFEGDRTENLTLGNYAFRGCTALTEVALVEKMTFGTYTFYECSSLASVTFAADTTTLSDYMFYKTGLVNITIPKTVTSIGKNTFNTCASLETVVFEDGRTSDIAIGNSAFQNCTALKSVTLVDKVTSLGQYTFRGCTALMSITLPSSVNSVNAMAFYQWTADQTIYVSFAEANKPSGFKTGWSAGATVVYATV